MKKTWSFLLAVLMLFAFYSSFAYAVGDSTPPVIEEVKILTPVVKPGSKVKIQVKAYDDISGIRSFSFDFKSPSNNNFFSTYIYVDEYEELSKTYIFDSNELSRYAEHGNWYLESIYVRDFAGNFRSITNYQHADFLKDLYFTIDPNTPIEDSEDPDVNDGFKSWEPKTNVDLNKEFTITFNTDFDIKTILEKNIYVTDSTGNRVPLLFIIDRSTDLQSSKVTIAPVGSYRADSTYTLYIKDILSRSGKTLNENVKMRFTTVK
ncbi:Ig-like domain-containing protein [Sporosarcina sp. 179-K 3D1 HS]|uniref:Ig-like domain-containing protein n=1 Tax=Sporosarcina sp. 179-K 3D1 HS TaxID=3232169 RepID=UPI0039A1B3D1